MTADNVTERARQIVTGAMFGLTTPMMVDAIVSDLADAGLLATPEHDAAVAAKTLREAQADIKARIKGMTEAGAEETYMPALHDAWSLLNNRVRDIEREAGESGADA